MIFLTILSHFLTPGNDWSHYLVFFSFQSFLNLLLFSCFVSKEKKSTGCPKKKFTLGNQHYFWTNGHSEVCEESNWGHFWVLDTSRPLAEACMSPSFIYMCLNIYNPLSDHLFNSYADFLTSTFFWDTL